DPHPTRVLPLRRRFPVRVVLQRRQLPPGEVHILIHVRNITRTDIRTQVFSPDFISQFSTNAMRRIDSSKTSAWVDTLPHLKTSAQRRVAAGRVGTWPTPGRWVARSA